MCKEKGVIMLEKYCKFLGIKPKYLYRTYYNESSFGKTVRNEHILTADYIVNLKRTAGGSKPKVVEVIKVYPDLNEPENYTKLLDLYLSLSGSVEIGLWNVEDNVENYFLKINTDNKIPRGEKLFLGVTMVDCLMKSLQYYESMYGSIKDASRSLAKKREWVYTNMNFDKRNRYLKGK
jgi:hypothetical protein